MQSLTQYCAHFPISPEQEIPRDSILRNIYSMFNREKTVILIDGPESSGKTVLLAQFARYYDGKCISYFLQDNYYSKSLASFFLELCLQMKQIPAIAKKFSAEISLDLQEQQLMQLFYRMYRELVSYVRNSDDTPYFFIIDGLDKLFDKQAEDNILPYLPPSDPSGVYLLLSSKGGRDRFSNIKPEVVPIQSFSLGETLEFFSPLLEKEQAKLIYEATQGMPGYLADIYRKIKNKSENLDNVLGNLPNTFRKFIEKEWEELKSKEHFIDMLALIVYSPESLNINNICEVLKIEKLQAEEVLNGINFIESINSGIIEINNSYKNFLIEKLIPYRDQTTQALISYYEKKQINDSALFLPDLYRQADNYESLVKLINVENLTTTLGNQRSSYLVRRNIRSLSEMAYSRNDHQRLFWGALTESLFTKLISTPPAIETQIHALLAQENYDQAIKLSYSCFLPEDRLMLFSKIGTEMIKKDHPVPIELIKSIEESVELIDNTVELTEALADKLLDICADLIAIQTNLALTLIEKIAESRGNSNHKNKLMDLLLTNVLIKAGPDDTTAEKIKAQISNESLNDFARAASSVLEKLSVEEVYKRIAQIQDVSAKVYLLQSWCNTNKNSPNLCEVIRFALDLMNNSQDYSPTQLQLRQLAQCLLHNIDNHETDKLQALVEQFDIYKDTIIKHPIDENARLELILAQLLKRWSPNEATERYYSVYFSIDSIMDIDSRCFVIVRLLLTLKELAPDDKKLEREFVRELDMYFETLLNSSADHLEITKKIISAITIYNYELAAKFAGKLNTVRRRDYAFGEILKQYTSSKIDKYSINFIYETLDKIETVVYREWVFIRILKRFTRYNTNEHYSNKLRYLGRIQSITHSMGKTFALAYFISWIYKDNSDKSIQLFDTLKSTFQSIDCLWEQVRTGFEISSILAAANRELASKMYFITNQQKDSSVFADERITEMYIETCKLIIRMVPDVLLRKDYRDKVYYCVKAIEQIPSTLNRSILLSSLALKCLSYGKKDIFNELSKIVLHEFEICKDEVTTHQMVIDTAPMLYEVERNIFFEKLSFLPDYLKDHAIDELLKYLFSKRMPIDPIDISNYPTRIDYTETLKIVEIIEYLSTDARIYSYIEKLVDSVTERRDKKYKTNFNERQVLSIVERLSRLINTKLPDPKNIRHDGYKIACRASLTRFKESLRTANAYRANSRWNAMNLDWSSLKNEIGIVPNVADRIYLQATVASESFLFDKDFSESLIGHAEQNLIKITNSIDRADRFQMVAKSYNKMSNSKSAKFLLEEAVKQSNALQNHETRDQMLGGVVELAHSIDPNFASGLANNIDSPMFIAKTREKILTLNLKNDPSRLDITRKHEYIPVISSACGKILNSLYSGRAIAQHENVISKWMYCCLGYDFETAYNIALWFVENSILSRTASLYSSKLEAMYTETLSLLDMISKMSSISEVTATTGSINNAFLEIVAPKMHTFNAGQKEFAMSFIKNWLRENTDEYIKIYDYYFSHSDLEILKHVPQNTNVQIVASMKQSELDINKIHENYKEQWKHICEQVPPETRIYIFATPSGRTPQHDRFIITDKGGIVLGTSLNGVGSRDTIINVLDFDEKTKIEKEIIDALIISPPRFIGDERLISRTFSLEIE